MDYLGKDIPKLGFGLMRPPMLNGEIDMEQLKAMVDRFLAAGGKYFDTAYGYLDGKSEMAAREALSERYPRERFLLATKLPAWDGARTAAEAKAMFNTSLERTGAGYFDFYLLHNCGDERTKSFDEFGIWDYVLELRAKGLVRHVGFSFHDKAEVLDELLTKHPEMEFVQLQINYADWESPTVQSRLCLETARRHGKPVVIMEPVKGGSLANPPAPVAKVFSEADPEASPASWALRFAASQEGVITVLSGMSNLAQMADNINTLLNFEPLDDAGRDVMERARAALAAIPSVPCTGCQYCAPGCPCGVRIAGIFSAVNLKMVYDNLPGARGRYGWITRDGGKASECVACGHCETVCPQHIKIIDELKRAAELLE